MLPHFISNTDLVYIYVYTGQLTWNISFLSLQIIATQEKSCSNCVCFYKHVCCYLKRILVKRVCCNGWHKSGFGSFLQTKWILKLPKVPRHTLRQTSESEHYSSVMHLVLLQLSTATTVQLPPPVIPSVSVTFWFPLSNTVGTKRCVSSRTWHDWLYKRVTLN